eukprot:1592103-Pyramimonas_sp.AAC.1
MLLGAWLGVGSRSVSHGDPGVVGVRDPWECCPPNPPSEEAGVMAPSKGLRRCRRASASTVVGLSALSRSARRITSRMAMTCASHLVHPVHPGPSAHSGTVTPGTAL